MPLPDRDQAPPCRKCEFFYVTWDPAFPWGCKMFGLKTAGIPAIEVRNATGRHCPSFRKNPKLKE